MVRILYGAAVITVPLILYCNGQLDISLFCFASYLLYRIIMLFNCYEFRYYLDFVTCHCTVSYECKRIIYVYLYRVNILLRTFMSM